MAEEVFRIRVGGEYALFSRPEFKVERVSYPLITPSAARGLLEAVYWKPEIQWEIREILVLRQGAQTVILRNEIEDRQGIAPIVVEQKRQQRASLVLKDVEYVITAAMVLRPHARDPIPKHIDIFRRRLERGQCHHRPYLGTREFAAWFEEATGDEAPEHLVDHEIGQMLFEIAYRESGDPRRKELEFSMHGDTGRRTAVGYSEALFFPAAIRNNRLAVPPQLYQQLYRMEGRDVEGTR